MIGPAHHYLDSFLRLHALHAQAGAEGREGREEQGEGEGENVSGYFSTPAEDEKGSKEMAESRQTEGGERPARGAGAVLSVLKILFVVLSAAMLAVRLFTPTSEEFLHFAATLDLRAADRAGP